MYRHLSGLSRHHLQAEVVLFRLGDVARKYIPGLCFDQDVKRRELCRALSLGFIALAGCTSDGTSDGAESFSATATDTGTPPQYDGELNDLRVTNGRVSPVTLDITISVKDSPESRELTVELGAESRKHYEELSILGRPVVISVGLDGETFEYTPQTDGTIIVTVTASEIQFEEVVS